MNALHRQAFIGLLFLLLVMASLLLIAAGTLHYWQAWVFLGVYFACSLAITLDLMKRDPALLARRMRGGPFAEKETVQKVIMSFASLGFIGLLVVPGLDRRLGWSEMPSWMAIAGDALMLAGWLGIFYVFRENSFTSSTIEVAEDQKVISRGPYAWVRHPMYAAALLMLTGIPVSLGSWWGLLVIAAILPAILWRLLDEEKFLARSLAGYIEYQGSVRYRLLPLIW